MPHVNSSGGDDLATSDEVKVYHHEGGEEDEQRSSENLSEDKLDLVIETEEEKNSTLPSGSRDQNPSNDKNGGLHLPTNSIGHIGYVVTPYPYPNGATVPSSLGGKMGMVSPSHPGLGLVMYNNDHFSSPPPAHMGIPPVHIDPKTGLPRASMLPFGPPPGQFPHPLYSPEFSQVQWQGSAGYPITTAAFRSPYSTGLVPNSTLARFSPPGVFPHAGLTPPGLSPPAIITPGPKQEIPVSLNSHENHRNLLHERSGIGQNSEPPPEKKKPHIKKPLNAFMLFMKENRAKVVAECTLKESAAINQILGRRWHALDRAEQAKYYEMARKEKELHLQLYPGWSARDNYAIHSKKKKRKKECLGESKDCQNPKKCRARFGLDQQNQWCKPCRRKKRCIRFLGGDGDEDDDDLSDCDNVREEAMKWEGADQDGTIHSSSLLATDSSDSNDQTHTDLERIESKHELCSSQSSPLVLNLPTTSNDTNAITVTT